ncbi:Glutamate carboxypeptidase 2, variant 2 [Balamuthia mandrillaris]
MEAAGIPIVEIEAIPVLLNMPLQRMVSIVSPENQAFNASLKEAVVDEDPTSSLANALPTFNGYSASGDVTGELIYVNYGRSEDFERLVNLTHDENLFRNKIVLVRYGKIFRGNKAKNAEDRGAIGCLIYSDPQDDGFVRGEVYPNGPWRPPTGVQRGTVWLGNGDPSTPGWPSTLNGPRLTEKEARGQGEGKTDRLKGFDPLPKIPVQPLSYEDALPLLKGLGGMELPKDLEDWKGGLDVPYNLGPGPVEVRIKLDFNFTVTNIWNVIGRIPGSLEKDRTIILGNHRDAWGFGAADPSMGSAVLLEVARAFGNAMKEGWKPRRNIVLASWDAEEYGLVGSMEFVERHEEKLREQVVAYLNVDVASGGTSVFEASGTRNLEELMRAITEKVSLPETVKLPSAKRDAEEDEDDDDEVKQVTVKQLWTPKPNLLALGSGSDHTGFLHYLGIPSVDFTFRNDEDSYQAVYHSNYDSLYWSDHWNDPNYTRQKAIGQVWALLALRLSTEPVLPFSYLNYADQLVEMISSLSPLPSEATKDMKDAYRYLNETAKRFYKTAEGVQEEIDKLSTAAALQQQQEAKLRLQQTPVEAAVKQEMERRRLNDRLIMAERAFINPQGTLGRLGLRHVLFAPSMGDSYSGQGLPTIVDPLRQGDMEEATFQMRRTAQMVEAAIEVLSDQLVFF